MGILDIFRKEPKREIVLRKVGIITLTPNAIELGVNDVINKKIVIYEKIKVVGNTIKYGKILQELPYSIEEARNLIQIKKIPLAERKLGNKFKFFEGADFGEVIN